MKHERTFVRDAFGDLTRPPSFAKSEIICLSPYTNLTNILYTIFAALVQVKIPLNSLRDSWNYRRFSLTLTVRLPEIDTYKISLPCPRGSFLLRPGGKLPEKILSLDYFNIAENPFYVYNMGGETIKIAVHI
jgi:hypothetical protein